MSSTFFLFFQPLEGFKSGLPSEATRLVYHCFYNLSTDFNKFFQFFYFPRFTAVSSSSAGAFTSVSQRKYGSPEQKRWTVIRESGHLYPVRFCSGSLPLSSAGVERSVRLTGTDTVCHFFVYDCLNCIFNRFFDCLKGHGWRSRRLVNYLAAGIWYVNKTGAILG